jgi:hypothetical protein
MTDTSARRAPRSLLGKNPQCHNCRFYSETRPQSIQHQESEFPKISFSQRLSLNSTIFSKQYFRTSSGLSFSSSMTSTSSDPAPFSKEEALESKITLIPEIDAVNRSEESEQYDFKSTSRPQRLSEMRNSRLPRLSTLSQSQLTAPSTPSGDQLDSMSASMVGFNRIQID